MKTLSITNQMAAKKKNSFKDILGEKAKKEETVKKALEELTPTSLRESKKQLAKKEYDKEYHSKQANVKISKEFHQKAKQQAKKRFMSLKGYFEYLVNEDSKNFDK